MDRSPCRSGGLIREMPVEISGENSADKRQRVAAVLAENNADYLAVTLPDNIARLLNVRGSDIPTSPVPLSLPCSVGTVALSGSLTTIS